MQSNTRVWIQIGAAVVIAVVAFSIGHFWWGTGGVNGSQLSTTPETGPGATRQDVPAGSTAPGPTSTNVGADVAIPTLDKPAASDSSISNRDFQVTVNAGKVSPDTIIANVGDNIQITFSAQDKTYDFIQPDYAMSWEVPQGGSKMVPFQATAVGKYTFYCPSCGGPAQGPVGYIVVVPKQ